MADVERGQIFFAIDVKEAIGKYLEDKKTEVIGDSIEERGTQGGTWRLSNTLDASFCVEALEEAIAKYGKPEIMNTDQGLQYTGAGWITTLTKADIKISMDGRGRYLDNIFIERLWRSLKQEAVYLHEITDGFQAKRIIDTWIGFYNSERPHTALDKRTPDIVYFGKTETRKAA